MSSAIVFHGDIVVSSILVYRDSLVRHTIVELFLSDGGARTFLHSFVTKQAKKHLIINSITV